MRIENKGVFLCPFLQTAVHVAVQAFFQLLFAASDSCVLGLCRSGCGVKSYLVALACPVKWASLKGRLPCTLLSQMLHQQLRNTLILRSVCCAPGCSSFLGAAYGVVEGEHHYCWPCPHPITHSNASHWPLVGLCTLWELSWLRNPHCTL